MYLTKCKLSSFRLGCIFDEVDFNTEGLMKVPLTSGQPLKVGTYLHCLVKTSQKVAMLAGEGRTVGVVIDPKKVYRSLVSKMFC